MKVYKCPQCDTEFRDKPSSNRRYCSKRCQNDAARIANPVEHFWARYRREGECLIWTRGQKRGYGQVYWNGKSRYAHRVAYELATGRKLDSAVLVCHSCDTPLCGEPLHLWEGSSADNTRDAAAKGIMPSGKRNGHYTKPDKTPRGENHWCAIKPEHHARGERVNTAKMTETEALAVVRLRAETGYGPKRIASMTGQPFTRVEDIIYRRTWKHLTGRL